MTSYMHRGEFLPDNLKDSIDAYVERGRPTGGFLAAVINNDLSAACSRADDGNVGILHVIVAYLYNECPAECWGYAEATKWWLEKKRQEREQQTVEEI